jgi:hypothetical protein
MEIALELNISANGALFDLPDVAAFLKRRRKRTSRISNTLAVWETCNAMRSAAKGIMDAGRTITHRLVRERLRHRGLKQGVMRSRYAQKFFFLMLRRLQCGDKTILCERAPPKIILPILALRD